MNKQNVVLDFKDLMSNFIEKKQILNVKKVRNKKLI